QQCLEMAPLACQWAEPHGRVFFRRFWQVSSYRPLGSMHAREVITEGEPYLINAGQDQLRLSPPQSMLELFMALQYRECCAMQLKPILQRPRAKVSSKPWDWAKAHEIGGCYPVGENSTSSSPT